MRKLVGYHRLTRYDDSKSASRINEFALNNYLAQTSGLKFFITYIDRSSDTQESFEDLLSKVDEDTALLIEKLEVLGDTWKMVDENLQRLMSKGVRVMVIDLPSTTEDYTQYGIETEKLLISHTNSLLRDICKYNAASGNMIVHETVYSQLRTGRPRVMSYDSFKREYQRVLNKELTSTELMKKLALSKATYYRYREQYQKERGESKDNSISHNYVLSADS